MNPVFVIGGWGDRDAVLKINGKSIDPGPDFHAGFVHRLDRTDLVVWIRYTSNHPMEVSLSPAGLRDARSQHRGRS